MKLQLPSDSGQVADDRQHVREVPRAVAVALLPELVPGSSLWQKREEQCLCELLSSAI